MELKKPPDPPNPGEDIHTTVKEIQPDTNTLSVSEESETDATINMQDPDTDTDDIDIDEFPLMSSMVGHPVYLNWGEPCMEYWRTPRGVSLPVSAHA
jgi:hypothetical protein